LFLGSAGGFIEKAGGERALVGYLKEGVDRESINELVFELERDKSISKVKYLSKEQALGLLRQALEADQDFFLSLENDNPLPASLEVYFKQSFGNQDNADGKSAEYTRIDEALESSGLFEQVTSSTKDEKRLRLCDW